MLKDTTEDTRGYTRENTREDTREVMLIVTDKAVEEVMDSV